jgi:hypothetical protein
MSGEGHTVDELTLQYWSVLRADWFAWPQQGSLQSMVDFSPSWVRSQHELAHDSLACAATALKHEEIVSRWSN